MDRVLWTLFGTLVGSCLFAAPLAFIGDSSNPILSRVSVILTVAASLCGIIWVILSVLAIPRTATYLEAVARGKQVGSLSKGLLGLLLAISPIVIYGTFLWLRIKR